MLDWYNIVLCGAGVPNFIQGTKRAVGSMVMNEAQFVDLLFVLRGRLARLDLQREEVLDEALDTLLAV